MRKSIRESLLREYIRQTLNEDDYGMEYTGLGVTAGMESPYGVSFGGAEDLKNTFIAPFLDVAKVALGQTKEITRKAATVIEVGLGTILTLVIPGISVDYASTFDKEREEIRAIRQEYRDVYERVDQGLKESDAALLAFMASPAAVIGYMAAKRAPDATKELMSSVTGGYSDKAIDGIVNLARKAGRLAIGEDNPSGFEKRDTKFGKGKSSQKSGSKSPSDVFGESILREDKKKITMKDILKSKQVKASIESSPEAKQMSKKATEIYRETLKTVVDKAENVLKKAKTIDDLEKASKKKIPEAEKIKKLPADEREKAEKFLIGKVREAMKQFYIKNLEGQVKQVRDAGIPEEAQYVKDYRKVISQIKSM